MISKLLSGAVKLYLRSQTEAAENLQVKIVGKNKQIIKGYIPEIWLSCDRAIYQGLHLSQVELNGTNIAVNLSEVIKKQPLKLLEPILVEIQLKLNAADLQASLDSALLQSGLSDLWQLILATQNDPELADLQIEWQTIAIADRLLHLTGVYRDSLNQINQLTLSTKLNLADSHTLYLKPFNIKSSWHHHSIQKQLEIDLGTDVAIEQLKIGSEQIMCSGKIKINN